MREQRPCELCGTLCDPVSLTGFSGQWLCPSCLENETRICSHCDERIWADDDFGDSSRSLCQECFDRYYVRCNSCRSVIPYDEVNYPCDDEDTPLCCTCYDRDQRKERFIHDYFYKPEPVFHGSGPRFIGVELEIDEGGEFTSNAQVLLDAGNAGGNENIYIKHDGSLSEGLEIVTHPASLDYHMNTLPWPKIMETARRLGYRSHQCGSCGLHCHVSRSAFGLSEEQQDACIARILYFVEKHWEELLKFSRRTPRQLEQWAARYGFRDKPMDILAHVKKGYHGGRYSCVNLENRTTIEIRLFRGTLKLNTLLATLQMVDRICDVALFMSDEEVKAMSWTTFVSGCTRPELIQYLKERRLYVNEPVSGGEEEI